jgi:hypothetical protein
MDSTAANEALPNLPPEAIDTVQTENNVRSNKDLLFLLLFIPLLGIFSLAI